MLGEINGVLCTVKSGTNASPVAILGQGTMSIEHVGDPILIDNKSSGEWQQALDGGSTTKAKNITVEFDYNDDPEFQTLIAAAEAKTSGDYVADMSGYYYEGTFIPSITSETANKNEIVKITITFTSNGAITRGTP